MSSFDAYEDEMGRFLRLSDEELARLLSGETAVGDEAFEEVASLLTEARTTFAAAPDAATRTRHIAAISEASQLLAESGTPVVRPVSKALGPVGSQVSGLPKWRRVIGMTKSLLLRAAAASLAASMSMVGLAYAGVDLPGSAAAEAIEAVLGVELPNQGDDEVEVELETELETELAEGEGPDDEADDVAHEIWNYISTTTDTGCVFGQNVAAIASGSDPTPDTDPCSAGDDGEATGAEKSAEGRASGDEGRATGDDAAEDGQANRGSGDDAADEGQSNNPTGKGAGSGDDAAEEGQANRGSGDDAADEGQSNNPNG